MKKNITLFVGLLAAAVIQYPGAAWAEGSDEQGKKEAEKNVFFLGEVVVEGEEEAVSKVATTDTADRERMQLNTSQNVSDALNTLPGVNLNIGAKNERNLLVRGFNERYIPVFYDGIPIYIPNDGFVDTGKLSTSTLSKITLTKGNSSVLYGPNSMGGVVNIITMRPSKLFEGDIAAGISQDDTYDLGLNLGSRVGMFYFMAGGTMSDSDGYRLSRKFEPTLNEDGDVRFNSDRDEEAGSFKIGFIPAEGHEYAVGVNHVNSEWGLPPHTTDRARYWRFSDWEKTTYYFLGDTRITDKLSMKTRLFRDEYENVLDSYDDDTFTTQDMGYAFHSIYDDYSNGGSVIVQTGYIPMNTFSIGFIYKEDVHREKDDYETEWEQYEAETYSFVAEDEFKITEDLSLVAGAAYDINKAKYANGAELRDDEKSFNPMGGVNWYVFDYTRLHASVGKKTRFPTLQELYSGYFGRNEPNPYLEEERAINYEAGIEQEIPCLETTVSFSVFRSDIKDLIVRREIAPKVDQYQNIGMARYQGFETSLKSEFLKNNRLEVHYTYLDAENRSHGRTSDHLEERPKHNLYISDLYTPIWWLSFFAKFQYNSRRLEENTDTLEWEKVAGFWTVDGKVIVRVAKNVAIEAGARNIFDDNYELRSGYPREGRSLFALARVTF